MIFENMKGAYSMLSLSRFDKFFILILHDLLLVFILFFYEMK